MTYNAIQPSRGVASMEVSDFDTEGLFTIIPTLSSVSPSSGSLAGGTEITIAGSGLAAFDGLATVYVGGSRCTVTAVSSDAITCITPAKGAGTYDVKVYLSQFSVSRITKLVFVHILLPISMVIRYIYDLFAISTITTFQIEASGSASFMYASSSTPTLTTVGAPTESGDLTISGTGFGGDVSSVQITLTPVGARKRRDVQETMVRSLMTVFSVRTRISKSRNNL